MLSNCNVRSSVFTKTCLKVFGVFGEDHNDINMHKCNSCFCMFLGVFWTSKSLRPPQDFCSGFEAKVVQFANLSLRFGVWGSSGFWGFLGGPRRRPVVTRSCAPRSSGNLVVGFDSLKGRFVCLCVACGDTHDPQEPTLLGFLRRLVVGSG
jgi:hypothetical protein